MSYAKNKNIALQKIYLYSFINVEKTNIEMSFKSKYD